MGRRSTQRAWDKEREQAELGDGGGEKVGEPAWENSGGGKGKRLGMGKEERSWDREGERKEVGQRPSREQEDEGSKREERETSVTHALQLFLVSDAPSQVRQFCISTQLLQRHTPQRMAVDRCSIHIICCCSLTDGRGENRLTSG